MSSKLPIEPGMIGYLNIAVDQKGVKPWAACALDVFEDGTVVFVTHACPLPRVTLERDHAARVFTEDETADIGTLKRLLDVTASLREKRSEDTPAVKSVGSVSQMASEYADADLDEEDGD